MDEFIATVKRNLQQPLPGTDLQYVMAPNGRREYAESITKYTEAAVLALLYPRNKVWHMVFIQRTTHKKDKHSAQIAFPGGRVEPEDKTMVDAALREAEEEIGVNPEQVQVLKELTPLKIPISGFEVYPVLAYTENEPEFVRQVSEVEKIIEVPYAKLTDPNSRQKKEIKLSTGMILKDVPIFNFDGVIIWGATSMMLNEAIATLT